MREIFSIRKISTKATSFLSSRDKVARDEATMRPKIIETVSGNCLRCAQSISGIHGHRGRDRREIKEVGERIGDIERGKINKFRGATVSLGDTDSHPPAGGACKTAGWMLSKQRVAAVHAEDFATSLAGCTLRLRALFPSLPFLSRVFPRVREPRAFSPLSSLPLPSRGEPST